MNASLRLVLLSLALTGSTVAGASTLADRLLTAEDPPKAPSPKPPEPKPDPKPEPKPEPKPDPKPDPKSPQPTPPAPKDPKAPGDLPPLEKPKGIPDGEMKPFVEYWENSKTVKFKYEMRKDPADGKWKRNGYSQAFYATGPMEREGYYKNNERVGRWRYFNMDGSFNRIEERGDGKPQAPKAPDPKPDPKPPEPKPEPKPDPKPEPKPDPKPTDPKPGAPK